MANSEYNRLEELSQPDEIGVVEAIFVQVKKDLIAGRRDAQDWLDSPAFVYWATIGAPGTPVDELRSALKAFIQPRPKRPRRRTTGH